MGALTGNTVPDIHYSCSNIKKSQNRKPEPRNFYLMTLEELKAYWDEMDEKFALQEMKEAKLLPTFKAVNQPEVVKTEEEIEIEEEKEVVEVYVEDTTPFLEPKTDGFQFEDDSMYQFEDDSMYQQE